MRTINIRWDIDISRNDRAQQVENNTVALANENRALTQEGKIQISTYENELAIAILETGEAKTYIGNIDSDNIHSQDVDIITSPRSTGSLLKPFLYAAAIDEGLITPNQLLKDYPVFFEGF